MIYYVGLNLAFKKFIKLGVVIELENSYFIQTWSLEPNVVS